MTKFLTFAEANQNDPRVARILKLLDAPLTINSKVGKLIGELMREVEEA